jgi:hypothetical protein
MIQKFLKPLALASACALFLSATALAQTNGNMNGNTNGNMNGNSNTHMNRRNPSPGTPRRVHRGRNTNPGTRRGPINTNGNSTNGNSNNGNTH